MNTPTPCRLLWISKYWLSSGLRAVEWDGVKDEWGYVRPQSRLYGSMRLGTDAHETEAGAVAAVAKARATKIASLRKQIAKLEAHS